MKDVEITDKHPSTLLLDKHIKFIAAYSLKKDDYVSIHLLSWHGTSLSYKLVSF